MAGGLVSGGRIGVTIGLNKDEPRRIVLLLNDVEAPNARFLHAFPRVGETGLLKCLNTLRFDVDMDVDNEHGHDK